MDPMLTVLLAGIALLLLLQVDQMVRLRHELERARRQAEQLATAFWPYSLADVEAVRRDAKRAARRAADTLEEWGDGHEERKNSKDTEIKLWRAMEQAECERARLHRKLDHMAKSNALVAAGTRSLSEVADELRALESAENEHLINQMMRDFIFEAFVRTGDDLTTTNLLNGHKLIGSCGSCGAEVRVKGADIPRSEKGTARCECGTEVDRFRIDQSQNPFTVDLWVRSAAPTPA